MRALDHRQRHEAAEPVEVDAARRRHAGEDQHGAEHQRQRRQRLGRQPGHRPQHRGRRPPGRQPAPLGQRQPGGGQPQRQHLVDQPVEREGGQQLRRRRDAAERGEQHRLEDAETGRDVAEDAEDQRHREQRQQRQIVDRAGRQQDPERRRRRRGVARGDGELAQHQAGPGQLDPAPARQLDPPPARGEKQAARGQRRQRRRDDPADPEPGHRAERRRGPERPQRRGDRQPGAEGGGDEDHHAGDVRGGHAERGVVAQPDRAAAQRPEAGGLGHGVGGYGAGRDAPPGLRLADRREGVEVVERQQREADRGQRQRRRQPPARGREQRLDHRRVVRLGDEPGQRERRQSQHRQREDRGQRRAPRRRPGQRPREPTAAFRLGAVVGRPGMAEHRGLLSPCGAHAAPCSRFSLCPDCGQMKDASCCIARSNHAEVTRTGGNWRVPGLIEPRRAKGPLREGRAYTVIAGSLVGSQVRESVLFPSLRCAPWWRVRAGVGRTTAR